MIDFAGDACVNFRKMESTLGPDRDVFRRISRDYALIQLYVDVLAEKNGPDILFNIPVAIWSSA